MAPEAMQKLIELMQTGEPKIAIQAANAVLDRAYGKPAQAIAGPDGDGPAELLISWAQSQS